MPPHVLDITFSVRADANFNIFFLKQMLNCTTLTVNIVFLFKDKTNTSLD